MLTGLFDSYTDLWTASLSQLTLRSECYLTTAALLIHYRLQHSSPVISDLELLNQFFSRSLTTGCVPAVFKAAYVWARPKKVHLDSLDERSYRQNLQYVSRFEAAQTTSCSKLSLFGWTYIGGLRHGRSWHASASTGLFLYQIVGSVQHRFQSYLSNRLQHVRVWSSSSSNCSMVCGVPQGSVLGAILHLLYCELPAADHWKPRTLRTSVCWWLTDLQFLSSISILVESYYWYIEVVFVTL